MTILPIKTAADLAEVRMLFVEYLAESKCDLSFQNFEDEIADLPGEYEGPFGRLLLARGTDGTAGCVAFRKLSAGICEMKRMYVRPAFRRQGIGKLLVTELLRDARHAGYETVRLDTLTSMAAALSLYQSFGFRKIPAYYANPLPRVVYLELTLERLTSAAPESQRDSAI
ncbi:MAG: hypothetical protein QOF48_894 [Verrucomicrobiota bacterium]|jgi:ribosomal protein S18 acetylase RimI-like enzyme